MRLWTLHPKYLDPKGLVALWREALLAQAVLRRHTKAYAQHPQLVRFRGSQTPVRCIAEYLRGIHAEGKRRGYKFDSSKIARGGKLESLVASRGQLRYEWFHLLEKVRLRNPKWFQYLIFVQRVDPHPLFTVIQGGIAEWEKLSDAAQLPVKETKGPLILTQHGSTRKNWKDSAVEPQAGADGCPAEDHGARQLKPER